MDEWTGGLAGGRAGGRRADGRMGARTDGSTGTASRAGGVDEWAGGHSGEGGRAGGQRFGAWQIPNTNPLCMQMDEAHAHTGTFARAHTNTLALPTACSCGGVHIEETKAVTLAMICVVPCVQIGCTVLGSVVQNCHQHRMPQ